MIYKIGNITIDSDEYKEKFAKCYRLPFIKEIIEISGCSLKDAKELIDKVISEENICIDPISKEIQDYCLAEYQDSEL